MSSDPRLDNLQTVPLFRLITVAGQLLSRHFQRVAEGHGLSPGALALLTALSNRDNLTHREAAEWCWLSPGTLTGIVDGLERQGLVERHRQDDDRRVVRIRFTEAGRERAAISRRALARRFGSGPAVFAAEEEAVVRRYLVAAISGLLDDPNQREPDDTTKGPCAAREPARPGTPTTSREATHTESAESAEYGKGSPDGTDGTDTDELASTAVRRTMQ